MALMDFTIPGSTDPTSSPDDVKRRMAMADALTKQGGDTSPVVGWSGILARALQGGLGGIERGQARQEEAQGRSSYQQQLASALGDGGKISPQAMIALAGNQWANPAQTQAISHVSDMEAQKARQGVEDQHWNASFGLQKQAAARAEQAAARAEMTPEQQAMEREKAAAHYGLSPDSPGYQAFVLTNKLPDANKDVPNSVSEYQYYTKGFKPTPENPQPMDYATFSTAKARAGATNVSNNIDMNSGQTYDKQLAEGLGKAHASLANDVEGAQTRARDIAAMQGAVDAIQKNGGTTGGLAPATRLEIQKSLNAGASALGIDKPFNEGDLSDKEFLTKFNRSMAGAQAKNAVGSRVTNFEMSNFLKANPGLDMTLTGNQRLLGIQAQMEQRNVAVGNTIRNATAAAISKGQKIDPVTVQKILADYDEQNHIKDPVTGQDLTQSYALPEFQNGGTNPALSAGHDANVKKIRRYNPATNALE